MAGQLGVIVSGRPRRGATWCAVDAPNAYLGGFRAEAQIVLAEVDGAPAGYASARLGGLEDGAGHIARSGD